MPTEITLSRPEGNMTLVALGGGAGAYAAQASEAATIATGAAGAASDSAIEAGNSASTILGVEATVTGIAATVAADAGAAEVAATLAEAAAAAIGRTLESFGAVGDGTADDTAAYIAAAAWAGAVPSRTILGAPGAVYRVASQITGLEGGALEAGLHRPAIGGSGTPSMIRMENWMRLDGGKITAAADAALANGVYTFGMSSASDVKLTNLDIDGGVIVNQTTGDRNANSGLFLFSSGTTLDGLTFADNRIRKHFWGLLKSNTTISTEKHLSFVGNDFDEMGSTYLLFNSPADGSLIEDVLVAFNRLGSVTSRQPFGSAFGYPHRGSFAGNVHYTRLIGNHADGQGGELFRAEEAAKASVWLGNTAKLDGKDGIEIIANNAGGTVHTPTMFAVGDNVLENVGLMSAPTLGWGIGLHVYTSASGLADAECIGESTVHDNITKGWAQGLQVHQGAQRNLLHHNILIGADEGIKTWAPTLTLDENMVVNCTDDVVAERGGMMGRLHFRSALGSVPGPGIMTVVTGPLSSKGWTWEGGRSTVQNGDNYYQIIEAGARMEGQLCMSVMDDTGVNYSTEIGHVSWDGTNMTYYREKRVSAGAVVISSAAPVGIDSNTFAIHIFNASGGALSNYRIQVAFDGLHTWTS